MKRRNFLSNTLSGISGALLGPYVKWIVPVAVVNEYRPRSTVLLRPHFPSMFQVHHKIDGIEPLYCKLYIRKNKYE